VEKECAEIFKRKKRSRTSSVKGYRKRGKEVKKLIRKGGRTKWVREGDKFSCDLRGSRKGEDKTARTSRPTTIGVEQNESDYTKGGGMRGDLSTKQQGD